MNRDFLKQLINRYEAAHFTVYRRLGALIKEQMDGSMTIDQYSVIKYIRERGRCTSSELAEMFCVGKSSITAIISRLFDKRLIQRKADEKDRRVTYLSLTSEGEQLAETLEGKIQRMLSSIMNHFHEQEARAFIETYEKLARVLAQPDGKGSNPG